VAPGLDYPGVGPEHSYYKDTGRATYVSVTDDQALEAVQILCQREGILPALESAHALAYAMTLAADLSRDKLVVVNVSGRGDKDLDILFQRLEGLE
jgi:tryptophan synthase beta chain